MICTAALHVYFCSREHMHLARYCYMSMQYEGMHVLDGKLSFQSLIMDASCSEYTNSKQDS